MLRHSLGGGADKAGVLVSTRVSLSGSCRGSSLSLSLSSSIALYVSLSRSLSLSLSLDQYCSLCTSFALSLSLSCFGQIQAPPALFSRLHTTLLLTIMRLLLVPTWPPRIPTTIGSNGGKFFLLIQFWPGVQGYLAHKKYNPPRTLQ